MTNVFVPSNDLAVSQLFIIFFRDLELAQCLGTSKY